MAITVADVREILPASTSLTDAQIQAAIDASQCLIDQFSASFCGESYSQACLDQIHKYLAAHFCAVTENTLALASESSDGCCRSSVKYSFQFGEGVKGTPYGQAANTLSGGCLQEYDKTPANIFSIGAHGGDAAEYYN